MAMKLEFWQADGPTGESLEQAIRVAAWEIPKTMARYTTPATVVVVLTHTSRQRGQWVVWTKPGYVSSTFPHTGAFD